MTNENDTVSDIIDEMRDEYPIGHERELLIGYADRIEVAHNREVEQLAVPTPEQWTEIARQGSELADLKRENERLREALRVVLECDESSMVSFKDAVHAAKRIAQKDLLASARNLARAYQTASAKGAKKRSASKEASDEKQ